MKLAILLILLSSAFSCIGQDSLNQIDQNGFKIGKWVEYNDFNKRKKVTNYSTRLEIKSINQPVFEGKANEKNRFLDTVQETLWTETYFYDSFQNLKKVEYFEKGKLLRTFYGNDKQISIATSDTIVYTQRQWQQTITIPISNYLWEPVLLNVKIYNGDRILHDSDYKVLPQSRNNIDLIVPFVPGKSFLNISVSGQYGIEFNYNVTSFGSDLSFRNLDAINTLQADSVIVFRRESELLCQAYSINKKRLIKSYPLSLELTSIDLSQIQKTKFWLKFTSLSDEKSYWILINMKK